MEQNKKGLISEMGSLLKANIHKNMMVIALLVIIIFFTIMTNGGFLSARNITNLINQSGYVAILAIGMTVILIIKHIDLSVGYVAGFSGAIAAILITQHGMNARVAMLLVMLMGLLIGFLQGTLITRLGVPAFVTTLAGMFIFRGLLNLVLQDTGTIIVNDEVFNSLSDDSIVDLPIDTGLQLHLLTLIIGVICVAAVIYRQAKIRSNRKRYNAKCVSTPLFVLGMILVSVLILVIVYMLATYSGLPISAVIVAIVLLVYNYVLNSTKLGRSIYGIGGNEQAAELSGVNVKGVTLIAFCAMGCLASLAGIMYTSRLQSATMTAGLGFEMDAIASAYIGGTAVSGGVGKVTSTIIGVLIIMSLTNGMNLMGVDISLQYVIKGIIFVIAVAFDVRTRAKR